MKAVEAIPAVRKYLDSPVALVKGTALREVPPFSENRAPEEGVKKALRLQRA